MAKTHSGLTTHELRSWFNWTQQEMATYWQIPLKTIQNWDSRECMPPYVQVMAREIRESWNQTRQK